MRAMIVDDEVGSRHLLRALLEDEPSVELVGEAGTGRDAIDLVRHRTPDLLFLDIEMPELGGFEVLRELKADRPPAVVLVDGCERYAVKAFEVHACGYLLKPFDRDRLRGALGRAQSQLGTVAGDSDGAGSRVLSLLNQLAARRVGAPRLVVRTPERAIFLRTETIDWIEAAGKFVHLHVGRTTHPLRESMAELEQELDPARFLRISRSVIVNLDRIQEVQPWFQGDYVLILTDGTRLTSTRGYRENMRRLLGRSA
jgi:two-component system, LytTR family, response regulator